MNFSDLNLGIPVIPLEETITKKTIKTETESGYLRTRARSIRGFKKFKITYKAITDSKLQDLLSFFDDVSGNAFSWTHPVTNTPYDVVFESDDINYSYGDSLLVDIEITLREVW